ncbi:L-fuculose phosphate aldolase [Klebsiella pneumoniae]|nr:L-fuculose phosphate aldolase [Klebsiella pneumoniae]
MERNRLARQIIDTCLEMTRLGLNQGTIPIFGKLIFFITDPSGYADNRFSSSPLVNGNGQK